MIPLTSWCPRLAIYSKESMLISPKVYSYTCYILLDFKFCTTIARSAVSKFPVSYLAGLLLASSHSFIFISFSLLNTNLIMAPQTQ